MNTLTDYKANALHLLVRYCKGSNLVNMVRYLINIGIDVGARDKSGNDALSFLTRDPNHHQEVALRLIKDRLKEINKL